jgi:hypothetical protein
MISPLSTFKISVMALIVAASCSCRSKGPAAKPAASPVKQVITRELPDTDTLSADSEESPEERARKMPAGKPGVR